MKKTVLILISIVLLAVPAFCFELIAPETGAQGQALTVFISGVADPCGIGVSLNRGDNVYSKTEAFLIGINGKDCIAAVLGIPSTVTPGSCEIKAGGPDGESVVKTFEVVKKDFIEEKIELSRSMSTLRKSDDSRKTDQWRTLLSILRTVDTAAVYETDGLVIPVESIRRTSFFGDRRIFLYNDGTSARSIHNGVDYSAATGTPIYAAGRGRVVFAGERIISGHTVVLEHLPGLYSLYYHMDSTCVEEGSVIEKGTKIGTVGATGLVTGAHLHWEVRAAGVAVDPEALTGGNILDKTLIMSTMK